jgi:hypothetical protein
MSLLTGIALLITLACGVLFGLTPPRGQWR